MLRAHSWRLLPPWATALCPWHRGPRRQMYIFAKFVADHTFLQNRDKINILKKFPGWGQFLFRSGRPVGPNNNGEPTITSSLCILWPIIEIASLIFSGFKVGYFQIPLPCARVPDSHANLSSERRQTGSNPTTIRWINHSWHLSCPYIHREDRERATIDQKLCSQRPAIIVIDRQEKMTDHGEKNMLIKSSARLCRHACPCSSSTTATTRRTTRCSCSVCPSKACVEILIRSDLFKLNSTLGYVIFAWE
jgi:hypothetical protein